MDLMDIDALERDMYDVAVYVREMMSDDEPVIMFEIDGHPGVFPGLDVDKMEHLENEDACSFILLYSHAALEALGYRESDVRIRVMLDPLAVHVGDSPERRDLARYRMSMMGVNGDE